MAVPLNLPGLVTGALERAMRQIDRLLIRAVATGEDARATAAKIARFLNPRFSPRRDATGTRRREGLPGSQGAWPARPGMASAHVRLIAEHEINTAHGARATIIAQRTPGLGIRWLLSPTHSISDECDGKAFGSSAGLPRGVYLPTEVPVHPSHVRCRCQLQPVPLP